MVLIVLGGLGFVALEDLRSWWTGRRAGRRIRLSLHSRLVFTVSAVLLVGGGLLYALLEWENALAPLAAGDRTLNALFMSVTARTAGFNTVDHSIVADSTNFLTILLMSIGGSPGSTAGGLKTTTAVVIVLVAAARLRGRPVTSVHCRTIPDESVQRAIGLFVIGFTVVTGAILLYAVTHLSPPGESTSPGFLHFMFEAVSAFNTVGLSMGATPALDSAGKGLTIVLMYAGRVGPLAIAAAVSRSRGTTGKDFRYAYEDVIIG
jgi:trk system potassium uptake protein TrkH